MSDRARYWIEVGVIVLLVLLVVVAALILLGPQFVTPGHVINNL